VFCFFFFLSSGFIRETDVPGFVAIDFTESERALMELALQVMGMKMTGRVEAAVQVALRIVQASSSSAAASASTSPSATGGMREQEAIAKEDTLLSGLTGLESRLGGAMNLDFRVRWLCFP
jgi:hypothetical protein